MNGGYFMIDCKGLNLLAESAQTISGLSAQCEKAIKMQKPVFANNVKWGTVPMTPIPVMINKDSGQIVCTSATLQIWVASNDSVTIVNMIQG